METNIRIESLKFIKHEVIENTSVVSLIDIEGYEINIGYGKSIIEAINDLHYNLM